MNREAVGVVIPAKNEAALVSCCIESVLRAGIAARVTPLIALVDDGSNDETARVANAAIPPEFGAVYSIQAGNAGAARAFGVERLAADSPFRLDWIATTDADSTVPIDWFERQLRHSHQGADAVAGIVDIGEGPGKLRQAFIQSYRRNVTRKGHPHVHGANLGVRLESCLSVGNFRSIPCGEDQDLWLRLRGAGCVLVSDSRSVVRTSPRIQGRAEGGFAADLRRIAQAVGEN
jgi:glycosyltransferase involved in cell wall biosynthesis